MKWLIKHRRTNEELATVNTLDDAIKYVRENNLRVWLTNHAKHRVDVVEDERKVQPLN